MCCGRGVRVYVCLRWPSGGYVSESCVVGWKEIERTVVMAAAVAVLMLSVVGDLWQASPKVASFPVQVNVSPSFQTSSSITLHSDTSPHSQDASFEPRCISSLMTVTINHCYFYYSHALSRTHPLTLNITFQLAACSTLFILWTITFELCNFSYISSLHKMSIIIYFRWGCQLCLAYFEIYGLAKTVILISSFFYLNYCSLATD